MPAGEFDCITSSYLAKYADLGVLIANYRRMLRPGGVVIMHDFTLPANPVYLSIWNAQFGLQRAIAARIFPEWRTVFQELPEFIRQSSWLPETLTLLKEQGFCDITCESLTFGTAAMVTARKPETSPH